jgi:hypothetical protein
MIRKRNVGGNAILAATNDYRLDTAPINLPIAALGVRQCSRCGRRETKM